MTRTESSQSLMTHAGGWQLMLAVSQHPSQETQAESVSPRLPSHIASPLPSSWVHPNSRTENTGPFLNRKSVRSHRWKALWDGRCCCSHLRLEGGSGGAGITCQRFMTLSHEASIKLSFLDNWTITSPFCLSKSDAGFHHFLVTTV